MKLSLGFAFALLLKLHFVQLVSTQTETPLLKTIPEEWKRDNTVEQGVTNETSSTTITPVPSLAADNVNMTSVSITPTPNILLNSTENTTIQSDQTFTQNDNATTTVTADTPPVTNGTLQNQTSSDTSGTTPSPESFTTNSMTNADENITTTLPSMDTNSTTSSGNFTSTTFLTPNTTLSTFSNVTTITSPTNTTILPNTENQTTPATTVVMDVSTTNVNITKDPFDARGNSDTDGSSGINKEIRGQAWGALLGIIIAVAIVLLVMYVIKRRRSYRDFSHRKLVEEMPQDPVLRLDNGVPLDLKPDGSAYYNPGVQGDSIQMTSFPRGQFHC